jgi:hypothetical protein
MRDFTAFWVGGHAPSLPDQQDAGGDASDRHWRSQDVLKRIDRILAKETAEVLGAEQVDSQACK